MDVNHLHLHVGDLARSERFYTTYLGFRRHVRHGDIIFLRNGDGFDLALAPEPGAADVPDWFHFGCRLASAEEVRAVHARMTADGVDLRRQLVDDADLVSFRAVDPDGYGVEVYWE